MRRNYTLAVLYDHLLYLILLTAAGGKFAGRQALEAGTAAAQPAN
jgi:hypothetical protein